MSLNVVSTPGSTLVASNALTHAHGESQADIEQDTWISLYYHLLWAVANHPTKPLVFQNSLEIHERFIRAFPLPAGCSRSSHDSEVLIAQSLKKFRVRCDELVPDIKWKLQQQMKPRIEKGSDSIVRGINITESMMKTYRDIREKRWVGHRGYHIEDSSELWEFLKDAAAQSFQPKLYASLKYPPSLTVQVQCEALLDSGERCELQATKLVAELFQNNSRVACDIHSDRNSGEREREPEV